MDSEYQLQVIIASGPDQAQRAILGLSMAASASAAGVRVAIFFAMAGAQLLNATNCSQILVAGFPSVAEFVKILIDSDGAVEYCPNCVDGECAVGFSDKLIKTEVCQLAKPGGMSAFALRMASSSTVVF
jgi:predicted peroxiredoxin